MPKKFQKTKTFLKECWKKSFLLFDYLIWFLFDSAKFKKIKTKKIKKILVVLVNQEKGNVGGDFITLGILNRFKKQYPKIRLAIFSDKRTINQFGKIRDIELIEYKEKNLLEKIKSERFDAAILLSSGDLKAKDFSFIPYVIGRPYFSLKSFFKMIEFGHTRKIRSMGMSHMVGGRFKLLEALGFKFKEKRPFLEFAKSEEKKARDFLKKNKVGKFIVIHPGGKYVAESYKAGKWPPHLWNLDRYARVADHFSEKGYKILITGSKEEEILVNEIKKHSKNKKEIASACGKLSIREAGALLKKARLLIATDTSIVHIAYQDPINAKIVELMGPSIPKSVGAWPFNDPKHRILVDKGPYCRSMRKLPLKNNYNCLKNISVSDVISASEELLSLNN